MLCCALLVVIPDATPAWARFGSAVSGGMQFRGRWRSPIRAIWRPATLLRLHSLSIDGPTSPRVASALPAQINCSTFYRCCRHAVSAFCLVSTFIKRFLLERHPGVHEMGTPCGRPGSELYRSSTHLKIRDSEHVQPLRHCSINCPNPRKKSSAQTDFLGENSPSNNVLMRNTLSRLIMIACTIYTLESPANGEP